MTDAEFHSASGHTRYAIGWTIINDHLRQRAVSEIYNMYGND